MRISDWSSDVCSSDLVELQEFLAAAAQQRQQAVRGDLRQRLGVVEVVAVLGAGVFLARGHARADHAAGRHTFAQLADQRGVLSSEERRVGKEWVSACSTRWAPRY